MRDRDSNTRNTWAGWRRAKTTRRRRGDPAGREALWETGLLSEVHGRLVRCQTRLEFSTISSRETLAITSQAPLTCCRCLQTHPHPLKCARRGHRPRVYFLLARPWSAHPQVRGRTDNLTSPRDPPVAQAGGGGWAPTGLFASKQCVSCGRASLLAAVGSRRSQPLFCFARQVSGERALKLSSRASRWRGPASAHLRMSVHTMRICPIT